MRLKTLHRKYIGGEINYTEYAKKIEEIIFHIRAAVKNQPDNQPDKDLEKRYAHVCPLCLSFGYYNYRRVYGQIIRAILGDW